MKNNMGSIDRIIRALFALGVGFLYYFDVITGVGAIVLGIIALVMLVTAFIGFCPAYVPFNINTGGDK